jgi:hypothetical protein
MRQFLHSSPIRDSIDAKAIDKLVEEFNLLYEKAEALKARIMVISRQLAEQAEVFEQIHRHQQDHTPPPPEPWRPRKPR